MKIHEGLALHEDDKVVALVGAGGKTTIMYRLARELADLGRRVVVTTTTRIYAPTEDQADRAVFATEREALLARLAAGLAPGMVVYAGLGMDTNGKVEAISPSWAADLAGVVDHVLVEADGAAGRPFKAPAPYEPVIPPAASLVVVVVGADACGRPLHPAYVHRPERVAALSGLAVGEPLGPEAIAQVVLHAEGGAKGLPPGARLVPFVNKVDGDERLALARRVAGLLSAGGAARVVLGRAAAEEAVREVVVAPSPGAVGAIVLAAGRSSRLGSPKLLLEMNGRTLIRTVVESALRSTADQVVVVVGAEGAAVLAQLEAATGATGRPVSVVENEAYASGQSSSLRAGLLALDARCAAALVLLGDQPFVTPRVIDAIIAAYRNTGSPLVVPVYAGHRSTPVLFDRALFGELLAVEGDQGGRGVVAAHRAEATCVRLDDATYGLDVDTWDDFALAARIGGMR